MAPTMVAVTLLVLLAQSASRPDAAQQPGESELALLRGRITEVGTGRPASGVRVRARYVTGVEHPVTCQIDDCNPPAGKGPYPTYYAVTEADGRYEMRGLRPGDYFVTAGGDGYMQRSFGQTSSNTPEVRLHLDGGRTTSADIELERAGVVTGRVLSDSGEGLTGIEVELVRQTYLAGGARAVAVGFAQTERGGEYRFENVEPGEYYVRAYADGSRRPTRATAGRRAYTATYFPSAIEPGGAQSLGVGSGQELSGIDFALVTIATHTVRGRLLDPGGPSLRSARVQLTPLARGGQLERLVTGADSEGRFSFRDVLPGDYLLMVADDDAEARWRGVLRTITIVDDNTELVIPATRGATVTGRISSDSRDALPFDVTNLHVRLEQRAETTDMVTFAGGPGSPVGGDGGFVLQSAVGQVRVAVAGLREPWHIRTVRLDGIDVTDRPFDLLPDDRRQIDITITDRVGRLSGTVTDRSGRPVSQAIIVVFPEDRTLWGGARLVRIAFSRDGGFYEVGNLPAGVYRAVAVTTLPRDAWTDPAVLNRLSPESSVFTVDDGGSASAQLRVTTPPEDLFR